MAKTVLAPELVPEIIAATPEYLVINKPAGLAAHAGGNLTEPTLADWLIANYKKIKDVGDDPIRPGLVHRLDKEVSGLMVIAKTQASFDNLKNQFKEREINKEYVALVHGRVTKDFGAINFPITRSQEGYKMAALPSGSEDLLSRRHPKGRDQGNITSWLKSRAALTEFEVLKRFVNYTLLKISLKTGRTHQIRVHFFAYGYPLVGDNLYCTKKTELKNKKLNLGRVFLVADHLSFRDLKGVTQDFRIGLPKELQAALPRN
ncbi:MAG: RNA pseudouridine synthase [Candidatus Falkowbacteria bacterium]|nr:RNA pseudouridine synthase [Candidatus Falkowbacteria bacterium]